MSITSSIFIIKPIVDLLHEDVLHYADNIKLLNQRIAELEKENAQLREVKAIKIEPVEPIVEVKEKKRTGPKIAPKKVINDADFAKEAETFAEPVNEVAEEKVVTVVSKEKTKKEYQQEYQRQYRKLKKEKQAQ